MNCMLRLWSWRSFSAAKHLTPCWIPVKLEVDVASCGLMIYLQGAALVCVTHGLVWLSRKSSMNNPKLFFWFCMNFCLKFLVLHLECFLFFSCFGRGFHIHQLLNVSLGTSVMWTLFREGFISYFLWQIINKILKSKIYMHPSVDVQCIPLWKKTAHILYEPPVN